MDIDELLEICRQYHNLGWAVIEQLHDVRDGEDVSKQNENAIEMIKDFVSMIPEEVEGQQDFYNQLEGE